MFMSIFSFFGPHEENVIIIDIGNGSVTGAMISYYRDKAPRFINSVKVSFVISEKPNAKRLIEGMSTVLDSMLSSLISSLVKQNSRKNKRLLEVIVTLSSPWFVSKMKHVHIEKEEAFVITKKFIDDINLEEEEIFRNKFE